MASLSTCHLGLWLGWQILLNLVKSSNCNPKSAAALIDGSVIRVGVSTITALRCVRNIGVFIDRHLDMKKHVSQTVSACSFYIRHINQISRFLPKPTKERVVNAIITLRLDYCNALLYGTSVVNIARLQRIHNSVARWARTTVTFLKDDHYNVLAPTLKNYPTILFLIHSK